VKAGKRAAKLEDRMDGKKYLVQDTDGMLERKEKNRENQERKKYWVKGRKTQRSKKEGRESKKPDTTPYERCIPEEIPEYLGERMQEKEKWWRDLDVGTRREKTGTGRKERKEGAEFAMRRERQLGTCGMDVAKWERGRERNREKYWMKTERMKDISNRRERIEKERGGR
jgi:hypothetical protein